MNQSPATSNPVRIAFIQARWHAEIVDECRRAFLDEIARRTNGQATVTVVDVPGAFEIPLLASRAARSGRFDAVVGAAFVVDGGIYRHEFVADAVVSALMQVQLTADVPVLSAVLIPDHFHETSEHRAFFKDHFRIKGCEVAGACLEALAAVAKLAA